MPGFPIKSLTSEVPLLSPKELEDEIKRQTTALAEAYESLRQGRERWRLAMAAGRMVSWDWEISTGRVILSQDWEALHGIPAGTFAGTFEAYQSDIHPEERESVMRSIQMAVEQGTEHHAEYRLVWPDGSVHWIEARGRVLRDESGEPVRMIGICMDIKERKQTEQSLQFLADASRSLVKLVDYQGTVQKVVGLAVPSFADACAAHLVDEDGELHQVAAKHVDAGKRELVEGIGRLVQVLSDRQISPSHVFRSGRSAMVAEISGTIPESVLQDDAHLRILRELNPKSYICVPLPLQGKAIGTLTFITSESCRHYTPADLAVAEDLGHRVAIAIENTQLYAQVKDADRRKDEFLAMLAHELRNPLAPIRSGLDLLSTQGVDGTVGLMQEHLQHLIRLVDDLLDVSRIMRGKIKVHKDKVRLNDIVERSLDAIRPLMEAQNHEVTVSMPSSPIWLDADAVRMSQVITNLLCNAAKYTENGGHIWLSVEEQGEQAVIVVRDSGIGIDKALLSRVFDLFTQGDRTLDRSQGGLGIGLTLVKELVEMHGGQVEARSEGAGRGSEFTIRLPTSAQSPQPLICSAESKAESPYRILVVEDSVAAAKLLARVLKGIGNHEVQVAYEGETGLKIAAEFRPDLVLLDIGLPGIDGFEVARRLRQLPEGDRPLVAAVTGYGQEEDRRRSREAGFDEHLLKPIGLDVVRGLLLHPKLHEHHRA
jgi:PAS domain S-box-containing protein